MSQNAATQDTVTLEASVRDTARTRVRLAALWDELLGAGSAEKDADFFSLGGQSLVAIQLLGLIGREFGVELKLRDLFEHPALDELAQLIATAAVHPADDQKPDEGIPAAGASAGPVARPRPRSGQYVSPLAPGQEQFWRVERAIPEAAFFTQVMRVDVVGDIDLELLLSALRGALRRHDVLHATFGDGPDGPAQTVQPEFDVPIRRRDHGPVPPEERERLVREAAKVESRLPFDLVREIPLRLRVLEFGQTEPVVLVVTHHIAFDGWSRRVLVEDVAALYRARVEGGSPPEPPALTYTDFAAWQAAYRDAGGFEQSRAYWLDRLSPPYPNLRLPEARDAEDGYRTASRPMALARPLVEAVNELAQRERTTVFTVLLSAVLLAVAARAGATEGIAAVQVANRPWPDTQNLVGPFANSLVLRTPIDRTRGFHDFLREVRTTLLEALDHQDIPLELVVEELRSRHGADPGGLLQLGFVLQDEWVPETPVPGGYLRQAAGLAITDAQELDPSTFGLTLELRPSGDGLAGFATYKADTYPPEAVDTVIAAFTRILTLATADSHTAVEVLTAEAAK